jgi:succinate-semialdehyde dehydrogenase/glutarate-semialdehyde dehydrogenase
VSPYKVVNPGTGETLKEYPTATDATIADTLTRVHAGYKILRTTTKSERAAILHRVADLYRDRADELAAIITREMGKTTVAAHEEIDFSVDIYRYYAEHGPALLADAPLPSNTPGTAWVRKAPVGAILGIMPWNYPYYQVARFAAPNIMIGNSILLKHAPQCPESALAMEKIFQDAGLPADAYINIFASNDQVADILTDPRICGVSVTGSERAGAAVAAVAGKNLKKVVLELGGSDPFIVLDTDDLPKVVNDAVVARMENGGQACNSSKRFIVADDLYDEFVEQFTAAMASLTTGDPTDPNTSYGPMSSEQGARNLQDQVQDAVSKGATLRTGGKRVSGPGFYFEPSVLTDVVPGMRAFREELFGPVAVVYRVANADEAVSLANDSPYGLGASVYTANEDLAMDVADRIDTGMVWINAPEGGGAELPFGGTKRSGMGRELGPYGIEEFVNKKLIHTPPSAAKD